MERWAGQVAIVTGASSVISFAIIKTLVEKGLKVVAISKRRQRIEEMVKTLEIAPGRVYPLKCDIAKEEDVAESFKWVNDNIGPLNVLINNAGLIKSSTLTEGAVEDWHRIFDINVIAFCICTREAVKIMKTNNIAGHIIHIRTIPQQHVTSNCFNVFSASKLAVAGLTEAVRQELYYSSNNRIKVTCISAIGVSHELQTNSQCEDDEISHQYIWPEDVAEAVTYVLSTPLNMQVQDLKICPLGLSTSKELLF